MDDQAPIMRTVVRSQPMAPLQRDSLGRTIWRGTARFIGFMGTITMPVAQACEPKRAIVQVGLRAKDLPFRFQLREMFDCVFQFLRRFFVGVKRLEYLFFD